MPVDPVEVDLAIKVLRAKRQSASAGSGADEAAPGTGSRGTGAAGLFAEVKTQRKTLGQAVDPVSAERDRSAGLPSKRVDLSTLLASVNLTVRQRECLSLQLEYGLSESEIAGRLDIDPNTVQEYLKLGRRRFMPRAAKYLHIGPDGRQVPVQ